LKELPHRVLASARKLSDREAGCQAREEFHLEEPEDFSLDFSSTGRIFARSFRK
jgi:hypothetical protein